MLFSFVWLYSTCSKSNPDKRKENSDCWFRIILWEPIWERGHAAFIFCESSRLVLSWTSTEPKLFTKGWTSQSTFCSAHFCGWPLKDTLCNKPKKCNSEIHLLSSKCNFDADIMAIGGQKARCARVLFLKQNCKSKQKQLERLDCFFIRHKAVHTFLNANLCDQGTWNPNE